MDLVKWKYEMQISILNDKVFLRVYTVSLCGQDKERDNLCFIKVVAFGK
jgi:hypothetical protein